MANFVLLYINGDQPGDDAAGAAVMQAWIAWFTTLGDAVVDQGNPFSHVVKSIAADGKASDGALGERATGYSIIKADSLDAAVKIAQKCPHLMSHGQLSVYEVTPVM